MTLPQFKIHFDPIANPEAVVQQGNVRFTVLTDRLIRMEHSPAENSKIAPVWRSGIATNPSRSLQLISVMNTSRSTPNICT